MPPRPRRCHRGSASSPSILPFYQPVHLSPVEISAGFACAGAGLILPQDRGAARHGWLLLQQVKL